MARQPRSGCWTNAACYHVLNRGHARETLFHDDTDRRYFLQLLERYRDRCQLRLYHYCLMDNHFHLVLQLPDAKRLSRVVAGLLVAYWHHYRRRHGLVGHLVQGRFKSPAIEADGYLLSCGRYVERNPMEAKLVTEPWLYRWSSCRAYALGEADGLLAPNPWYEELASEAEEAKGDIHDFRIAKIMNVPFVNRP
jgi:putative transposase